MVERFQTTRLRGRRRAESDFDDLMALRRDPEVAAWLGGVPPADQLRQRLAGRLSHWQRHGFGLWVLHSQADDAFAGYIGLHHAIIEGAGEVELLLGLCPESL